MTRSAGAVVVESAAAAALQIYAADDLPLHLLMGIVGFPVTVAQGGELRISGLPPGVIVIRSGSLQTPVDVRPGEVTRVALR
jgi:hypothetical protein